MDIARTFPRGKVDEMTAIGTSAVAFPILAVAVALLFLLAIRLLNGKQFKVTPTSFLLVVLVPLLAGTTVIGVSTFLEVHEEPALCGEYCHAMWPVYDTYNEPGNNSLMASHADAGVTCLDCHTGPGMRGQIDVYAVVPHEAYYEVMGKFDPEDLGGHVEPSYCLKCHDGDIAAIPAEVNTTADTLVNPHTLEADCADCHPPHQAGLGLSEDTCSLCHGTEIKDFDEALVAHGERVGQDCVDCHYQSHPDDAQIPWETVPLIIDRDFCSDCHVDIVWAYETSQTEASTTLYGDCTDCHADHNKSVPPHLVAPEHTDCVECHVNFAYESLMHNRTGITYLGVGNLTNEFCDACHPTEVKEMADHSRHGDLDCVSCHGDHELRVVFEDCTECHEGDVPAWHDETTTGCWNNDCHGTWFYHD